MYSYQFIKDEDYKMLGVWWKENRFPIPPKMMLPENGKGGIIVFKDEKPVCAGFLYLTNSNVGIIEYIVADFQIKDRQLRKGALQFLINELGNIAKKNQRTVVFTSLKNQGLKKQFLECGFVVGDENTTQLIKIIL